MNTNSRSRSRKRPVRNKTLFRNIFSVKSLQYLIVAAAIITGVSVCSITAISAKAEPTVEENVSCTYDVYKIQQGDTLEGIAKEYNTEHCFTNAEYISEIKRINSLYSDDIHAGCYLTIISYE